LPVWIIKIADFLIVENLVFFLFPKNASHGTGSNLFQSRLAELWDGCDLIYQRLSEIFAGNCRKNDLQKCMLFRQGVEQSDVVSVKKNYSSIKEGASL